MFRYKNIDQKMIELIMNEIMDNGAPVNWNDIAGLQFQKKCVKEIVVLPMLRPDIFTGNHVNILQARLFFKYLPLAYSLFLPFIAELDNSESYETNLFFFSKKLPK